MNLLPNEVSYDHNIQPVRRCGPRSQITTSAESSNLHTLQMSRELQLPFSTIRKNEPSQQPLLVDPHRKSLGFRVDYVVGEAPRSSSHMIIEPCFKKTTEKASQLKNHDYAWIKRSDGSWTYGILACKSYVNSSLGVKEECLVFALCAKGSTKVIKKHQWAKFIRFVATENNNVQTKLGATDDDEVMKKLLACYRQLKTQEKSRIPEIIERGKTRDDVSLVTFISY